MQHTNLKIAATVIIYNPDESVISNIQSYANYFDAIYIYDNSSTSTHVQTKIAAIQNVQLFQDYENKGISQRLNSACERAIENNFSWLLTMDQDSFFETEMIENYLKHFYDFDDKSKIAQFGISLKQNGTTRPIERVDYVKTDLLITSGCLLNLDAFKIIGNFDNAYFIDQVDNDYCIRSTIATFGLIRFTNVYLSHQMGEDVKRSSIKTLYLIKKYKTVHPPLRCYYIYRNLLYFLKKFEDQDLEIIQYINNFTKHYLKQSKLYNGSFFKTQKYFAKARKDFALNKMGRIDKEF